MRKKHQKYTIQSDINVVPFLDVLLILLIIFMMVPSQLCQRFEVNLPNSTLTKSIIRNNYNKSVLTIEIKETELYNIIFNTQHIKKDLHISKLYAEIQNITKLYPNITCLIAASKNIKYDLVIQVLNLLGNIGVNSVGIITNPINLY